jgi:hypothetical protein
MTEEKILKKKDTIYKWVDRMVNRMTEGGRRK